MRHSTRGSASIGASILSLIEHINISDKTGRILGDAPVFNWRSSRFVRHDEVATGRLVSSSLVVGSDDQYRTPGAEGPVAGRTERSYHFVPDLHWSRQMRTPGTGAELKEQLELFTH